jgi:hypothetical protein
VIVAGLKALPHISGKKILPFVTMGFPLPGMGGSQAIALMSKVAIGAGATVLPGTVVPKLFHNFKQMMERAASEIVACLIAGK